MNIKQPRSGGFCSVQRGGRVSERRPAACYGAADRPIVHSRSWSSSLAQIQNPPQSFNADPNRITNASANPGGSNSGSLIQPIPPSMKLGREVKQGWSIETVIGNSFGFPRAALVAWKLAAGVHSPGHRPSFFGTTNDTESRATATGDRRPVFASNKSSRGRAESRRALTCDRSFGISPTRKPNTKRLIGIGAARVATGPRETEFRRRGVQALIRCGESGDAVTYRWRNAGACSSLAPPGAQLAAGVSAMGHRPSFWTTADRCSESHVRCPGSEIVADANSPKGRERMRAREYGDKPAKWISTGVFPAALPTVSGFGATRAHRPYIGGNSSAPTNFETVFASGKAGAL